MAVLLLPPLPTVVPTLRGPEGLKAVISTPDLRSGVRLHCDITQGVIDRQEARGTASSDAWLRANDRTTWFNIVIACDGSHTSYLKALQEALCGSPEAAAAASFHCELMYADTKSPVHFMKEAQCQEKVTLIRKQGNTKHGCIEHCNGVQFASGQSISTTPALPAQDFFDIKPSGGAEIAFHFKFSTNVTSRRHGKRGSARMFYWRISCSLHCAGSNPVQLTAESHRFAYLSRPSVPPSLQGKPLVLHEVVSDARPGDIVTCVGENLSGKDVYAELRQGERMVQVLARTRTSKRVFVTRLPQGIPAGPYTLVLRSTACNSGDAAPWPLQVAPLPVRVMPSLKVPAIPAPPVLKPMDGIAMASCLMEIDDIDCVSPPSSASSDATISVSDSQSSVPPVLPLPRVSSCENTCLELARDCSWHPEHFDSSSEGSESNGHTNFLDLEDGDRHLLMNTFVSSFLVN